jgi:hypothetical protein
MKLKAEKDITQPIQKAVIAITDCTANPTLGSEEPHRSITSRINMELGIIPVRTTNRKIVLK